jgi:chemotaxis signal transduction protein
MKYLRHGSYVGRVCVDKSNMQTASTAAKHLIFRLGAETFGVDVMQVREIVGVQAVTAGR